MAALNTVGLRNMVWGNSSLYELKELFSLIATTLNTTNHLVWYIPQLIIGGYGQYPSHFMLPRL